MPEGGHLDVFFGSAERAIEYLPRMIRQAVPAAVLDEQVEYNKAHQGEGAFIAYAHPATPACLLALCEVVPDAKALECRSVYPFLRDGTPKTLEILDIKPDADDLEANLECVDHNGFTVTFFDPLFPCHRPVYRKGRKFEFSMAALAYLIEEVKDTTFRITEGPALEMEKRRRLEEDPNTDVNQITYVEFSMAEMRALIPRENEVDAEFQTVVEDADFFTMEDTLVCKMQVVLTRPNDEDFGAVLYATEHVLNGYRPKKGDSIRGVLWLQGYPLRPVEDPANWGDTLAAESPDHMFEGFFRAEAIEESLKGNHVGVIALGSSVARMGWDIAIQPHPRNAQSTQMLRLDRSGRDSIIVWVRAFIAGQEQAVAFSPAEMEAICAEMPEYTGKLAFVTVECTDIGKGHAFKVHGMESLEALTGRIGMVEYMAKPEFRGPIELPSSDAG